MGGMSDEEIRFLSLHNLSVIYTVHILLRVPRDGVRDRSESGQRQKMACF